MRFLAFRKHLKFLFTEMRTTMKKNLKRFISFILITMLTISLSIPVLAKEVPTNEKIKVTDEIAIQMAENFAKGAYTELSLSAANPIKLYESTGKAIGYIVNYYYNSPPLWICHI